MIDGRASIPFVPLTPVVASTIFSLVECLDLQITGALDLSHPGRVALFVLTHFSIALAASTILLAFLQNASALVANLVGRFSSSAANAQHSGTMLVLFAFHAGVWLTACLMGLYPRTGKILPIAAGIFLCGVAAWLFRTQFTAALPKRQSAVIDAPRVGLCLAVVVGAHIFNHHVLPKQYFLFHVATTIFALTAALLGAGCLLHGETRFRRLNRLSAMALGGAVVAVPMALFAISNDVRHALFTRAFDARALIYLARKLPGGGPPRSTAELATTVPKMISQVRHVVPAPNQVVDRVLLISIDTLRADHLPFYGYPRDTAPELTKFQRNAVRFQRAWADGPATTFAVHAIFSRGTRPDLPTALRTAGRKQTVVTSRRVEHAADRPWLESSFDKVLMVERDSDEEIAAAAVREIDRGQFPDLMWVHFLAPHDPYEPQGPNQFGDSVIDRYDQEIFEADRAVGAVLAALSRNGLADSTAVIVCSDHGEEFSEHGGLRHGTDIYSEQLRIPLLVRLPGGHQGVVNANVGQRDLPLTIADLLGIALPAAGLSRSLLPLVKGEGTDTNRPVLIPPFSTFLLGAVIWDRWKLNYSIFNGSFALYDLEADPHERINVFEKENVVAQRLRSMLTNLPGDVVSRK
jgi:choline-sulfatase